MTQSQKNINTLWQETDGEDLLKGYRSFQEFFESMPNYQKAFKLSDKYLRCMDEGMPGGLHLSGCGILYPKALEDLKDKIEGIIAHQECGAVAQFIRDNGLSGVDPDQIAEDEAKKLADKLEIPYLGMIRVSRMQRPSGIHIARVIYYDGSGSFDLSKLPQFPPGFIISRAVISDPQYAKYEVKLALSIAMGKHGFGDKFSEQSPFYLVAIKGKDSKVSLETLVDELKQASRGYHYIQIDSIVEGQSRKLHLRSPKDFLSQLVHRRHS